MAARFSGWIGILPFLTVVTTLLAISDGLGATSVPQEESKSAALVRQHFIETRLAHESSSTNTLAAWQFARACFDVAELSTNDSQRATLADLGIAAAKQAINQASNSAPARYYHAMNLGQLARTKLLGALPLVSQMEPEFDLARVLDEHFDFAGPDRCLGLLYRDAPSFASVGDKTKAHAHLKRALELEPAYPDNQLCWMESCLLWGERAEARKQLQITKNQWAAAQLKLTGPEWEDNWTSWKQRLEHIQSVLQP